MCRSMEEWLDAYMVQIKADQQPDVDPVAAALETIRGQIASAAASAREHLRVSGKGRVHH